MTTITGILFLSFATASLANWLDDCLQPGMILARWGAFVQDKYWLKPLGGCLICTCTWLNIVAGLFCFYHYLLLAGEWIALTLALIGISNTFLKFIIK